MADIWILCRKNGTDLTAVGLDISEAAVRDMADEGDFIAIPLQPGRLYANAISENNLGTISFSKIATASIVQQIKSAIVSMNQDISDLSDRLEALENA